MNESYSTDSQKGIEQSAQLSLKGSLTPLIRYARQNDKSSLGHFHKHPLLFQLFPVPLGFLLGAVFGWQNQVGSWQVWLEWGLGGGLLGLGLIALEHLLRRYPAADILQLAQSLAIGIVFASIFAWLMSIILPTSSYFVSSMSLIGILTFPYLTLTIRNRASTRTEPQDTTSWPFGGERSHTIPPKIFDTSTIIDGRILDLYETGFLEGPIRIPHFVLRELHYIADSPQSWKRARGKRGLEILSQLQTIPGIDLQITEMDFPHISEVDHKLIKLAQHVRGKIATNDWNLAKIASVEHIQTLNVNSLFHQLKPPVLPGETIRVFINKEGDLAGQGVAHLDDGTMIVVDQARDYVQETVDVVITKFMQTQSGRILFGSRL